MPLWPFGRAKPAVALAALGRRTRRGDLRLEPDVQRALATRIDELVAAVRTGDAALTGGNRDLHTHSTGDRTMRETVSLYVKLLDGIKA